MMRVFSGRLPLSLGSLLMFVSLMGAAPGCSFSKASEDRLFGDGGAPDVGRSGSGGIDVPVSDGGRLSSDAAQTCVVTTPQTSSVPADVLIVLDRSGSMNDMVDGTSCRGGCGAQSKWSQMTAALDAFIPTVQSTVNWGLKLFASPGRNMCGVSSGVDVAPVANDAAQVIGAIGATSPGSSTPTTAAVTAAAAYLQTLNDGNPKFILLATDGLPNCGSSPCAPVVGGAGAQTHDCDDANAIAAVKSVHDSLSISTFVIGIGTASGGGDATLTAMAEAGGYPRATTPAYYPVQSADDLTQVFQTITGMVQSCTFSFTPALDPTKQMISGVTADGAPLNANDYTISGNNAVQLVGQACADYMSGKIKNVAVQVACIVG
jgi:hypothetical protein